MKQNLIKSLLFSSLSLALLSGCASNPDNPNSGAQTGAVVGALAGSVIGYNTGHSHRGTNAVIGGALGAAAGAGIGHAVDSNNPPEDVDGGWQ